MALCAPVSAADATHATSVAVVVLLFVGTMIPKVACGAKIFACLTVNRTGCKEQTLRGVRTELYATGRASVGDGLTRVALGANNLHVVSFAETSAKAAALASFTAYRSSVCDVGGTHLSAATVSSASLWQWRHQYLPKD
jgi:hypothetical protein